MSTNWGLVYLHLPDISDSQGLEMGNAVFGSILGALVGSSVFSGGSAGRARGMSIVWMLPSGNLT